MSLKVLVDDHTDIAMKYEYLIRAAFDCNSKYCDPFSYAAQDQYSNFVYEDSPRFFKGQRSLTTALTVIVYRFQENKAVVDKLKGLIDQVWESKTQKEIIEVLNEAIEIGKSLDI